MNPDLKKYLQPNERPAMVEDARLFTTTSGQSVLGVIFRLLDSGGTLTWLQDTTGLPSEILSMISQTDTIIGKDFILLPDGDGTLKDIMPLAVRMAEWN